MRSAIVVTLALVVATLAIGCSTVGPGLANHPLDCAMGIAWADCQPGTAGYRNGGGQQTKAQEQQQHEDAIRAQFGDVAAQCKHEFEAATELDPIRGKVEFYRDDWDAAPPFAIAVLDVFPDSEERAAISKYATLRDACNRRRDAVSYIPAGSSRLQIASLQQQHAIVQDADAQGTDLLLALYQQKLTYGEFARKRYDITHKALAAERQVQQAAAERDEQRRIEAQRLAQQQAANDRIAWAAYLQALNARTPRTVHLNCTSYAYGNTVSTNCN
ncbi:MAG TPA: hypothetical protein VKV24_14575 [Casimicrobiaceae bacterium]|nr:hypothetical protein [Casimicrobiaceae bacterium]